MNGDLVFNPVGQNSVLVINAKSVTGTGMIMAPGAEIKINAIDNIWETFGIRVNTAIANYPGATFITDATGLTVIVSFPIYTFFNY